MKTKLRVMTVTFEVPMMEGADAGKDPAIAHWLAGFPSRPGALDRLAPTSVAIGPEAEAT